MYIDVDFPQLIKKKCDIIADTDLRNILGPYEKYDVLEGILLRSSNYIAIGCDLTNVQKLEQMLSSEIDTSSSLILCTAEVSITYMLTGTADALIYWAAQHEDSLFSWKSSHLSITD